MLPGVNHRAWRELLIGNQQRITSRFGFNLLLTNSRIFYQKDQSEANIAVLIEHLYDYLAKYEGLYQDELKQIFAADYTPLFGVSHSGPSATG